MLRKLITACISHSAESSLACNILVRTKWTNASQTLSKADQQVQVLGASASKGDLTPVSPYFNIAIS